MTVEERKALYARLKRMVEANKISVKEANNAVDELKKGNIPSCLKQKPAKTSTKKVVKKAAPKQKMSAKEKLEKEKLSPYSKGHFGTPMPNSKEAKKNPKALKEFHESVKKTPAKFKKDQHGKMRTEQQLWRDYITPSPVADKIGERGGQYATVKSKKTGKKRRVYAPNKMDANELFGI